MFALIQNSVKEKTITYKILYYHAFFWKIQESILIQNHLLHISEKTQIWIDKTFL